MKEIEELVKQLRVGCAYEADRDSGRADIDEEETDALMSQAASTIERMAEALKPFADMSNGFLGVVTDNHVRSAREALGMTESLTEAEQAARAARPTIFNVGDT